jgi:hypothetical protein
MLDLIEKFGDPASWKLPLHSFSCESVDYPIIHGFYLLFNWNTLAPPAGELNILTTGKELGSTSKAHCFWMNNRPDSSLGKS